MSCGGRRLHVAVSLGRGPLSSPDAGAFAGAAHHAWLRSGGVHGGDDPSPYERGRDGVLDREERVRLTQLIEDATRPQSSRGRSTSAPEAERPTPSATTDLRPCAHVRRRRLTNPTPFQHAAWNVPMLASGTERGVGMAVGCCCSDCVCIPGQDRSRPPAFHRVRSGVPPGADGSAARAPKRPGQTHCVHPPMARGRKRTRQKTSVF